MCFNGLLNKSKIYKKNFIPAYPDDLGVSIGAAYLADNLYNKKKRKIYHEKHNYFGPKFTDIEIKSELIKSKIKFLKPKNLTKFVAKKLVKAV